MWTSPQGKAELGFIIREGGCDLTGYSFGALDVPAGYLAPEPFVNLVDVDTGTTTVKVKIGLILDPDPGREFIVMLLKPDSQALYCGRRPDIGWMTDLRTRTQYKPDAPAKEGDVRPKT